MPAATMTTSPAGAASGADRKEHDGRWLRFLAGWGCGIAELPAVRLSDPRPAPAPRSRNR